MTTVVPAVSTVTGCITAIRRSLDLIGLIDDAAFTFAPEGHFSIAERSGVAKSTDLGVAYSPAACRAGQTA